MAYILLMPIGGPIHKAAIEAMDKLVVAGLWKGYCRGKMLGTDFYEDKKQSYIIRGPGDNHSPREEGRNGFWITVLSLVPWKPQFTPLGATSDKEASSKQQEVRSQRPVHLLHLSRPDLHVSKVSEASLPVVNGDIGGIKVRYIAAVLSSELITLIVGIVTATVWKNLFSIWYLTPLLLKITALLCDVRRKQVTAPTDDPKDNKPILCEVEDISNGFCLIEGKSELVLQFFRHYAHPERYRRSLCGDRFWEVISMLTIAAAIFVYPGGLIAFIFAPITIQWVWLGYQLYAMIAMHVYRFGGGEHIGTTQKWIARELSQKHQAIFDDGSGNKVMARLETSTISSVAEGRRQVEIIVDQVLQKHAMEKIDIKYDAMVRMVGSHNPTTGICCFLR